MHRDDYEGHRMSGDLVQLYPESLGVEQSADPAAYVTLACERAKAWLANALEHGDIEQIVELKSRAEAIRIYTQQKELGIDAELSAAEIVRRAERGIHVAVAAARESGELLRPGQTARRPGAHQVSEGNSVKTLADVGVAKDDLAKTAPLAKVTDEQFEGALAEAREEKNLTRANLVRKVQGQAGFLSAAQKIEHIRELAATGRSSRQIGPLLGISDDRVRWLARQNDIDIPADRVIARTHQIDPERVIRETVHTLEGIEYGINLLTAADYDQFDRGLISDWLDALAEPVRAIRQMTRELQRRHD